MSETTIGSGIKELPSYAFSNCGLTKVQIGSGVHHINIYAFSGCKKLHSIVIPRNVITIGDYALKGCTSLKNVVIADRNEIEEKDVPEDIIFKDWTSTNKNNYSTSSHTYKINYHVGQKLYFDWSVSSESGYDFFTVKLGGTQIIKESGEKTGNYTKEFTESGSIELVVSYTKDDAYSKGSDEGKIYNVKLTYKDYLSNDLFLALGSNGSSPFFSDCPLETVYIGGPIKYSTSSSYGYSPFYRNTSLSSVTIADTEDTIYDNEFYGCTGLKSVTIGDGVKTIGKRAFSGCSSMESFAFGSSMESIGQEAFSDCTSMTTLISKATVPPTCGTQALEDINKWECTLYVPSSSIAAYQNAPQWKDFFFMADDIKDIKTEENRSSNSGNKAIYSIDGRRMQNTQRPGLYIINGKKTIVR